MFTGSSVAIITPMTMDGQVDFDILEQLVTWHIGQGTNALIVAGTTGESATLNKSEHLEVIKVAANAAKGKIFVIAGIGSNSTAQTIELSSAVEKINVDGYLVVTPYYNKPPQNGLIKHFNEVADAVSRPVMLYNVPGRTGVDLLPETVAKLAQHPRIFGIKEATGDLDRVHIIRDLCGRDFRLYSGDDPTSREFMLLGGHGVVSVTANVAPKLMSLMCAEALSGNEQRALEIDNSLSALHRDLFIESNPIPVKWALEEMGLVSGGIRSPLIPLSNSAQLIVKQALESAGIETLNE
ncbi:MAG: 4-hydroxy-tetrahydrodipicolinate synthase [Pseudomonadota bacterium]|nr:4-hydroxy-tetrahydrodipicolinate synthase [Pseudomonadota bacterium]